LLRILRILDLVCPQKGVIDATHEGGDAFYGVEALVGVSLARYVGVSGDLPAAYIDRLEAGLHGLYGLQARKASQRRHIRLRVQSFP